MTGVDLSYHNGNVDFNSLKQYGVEFVILRAGYGRETSQKDKKFDEYYASAKNANIPVGAYWYSYADSVDDAKREADACISVLKGKQFEYPIFYDLEDNSQAGFSKDMITDIAIAFCERLESQNYYVGIYANTNWWTNKIDQARTDKFVRWLADYRANPNMTIPRDMLQYTSNGSVSGVPGRVDMNNSLKDFKSIIVPLSKNGFSNSNEQTPPATTYDYKSGTYTVVAQRLNVRYGPGTNYSIKPLSELSVNARAKGGYVKGVVFTATNVINNLGESWAETPSGFVCIQNKDGIYAEVGDKSVRFNYTAGDYKVVADKLNVRYGPSLSYNIIPFTSLTQEAQRQGGYVRGVIFTAANVVNNPNESWAKTPSGFVCIQNKDGIYAQRI